MTRGANRQAEEAAFRLKRIMIYLFLFALSMAFFIATDLLSGMSLPEALSIFRGAYAVVTYDEYAVIAIAILAPFVPPAADYIRRRRREAPGRGGAR